jgi:hypothetical protein
MSSLTVGMAGAWFASRSLQQDFAAYWVAGAARRAGLDPYQNHAPALWDGVAAFRHSRFLYPPLVADLFRPLAALPYHVAKTIFTGGAIVALVVAAFVAATGSPERRPGRAVLILGAGALFFPVYLTLERGQIDLYLVPLLILAWRPGGHPIVAGIALAAAGLFKPALFGVLPVLAALGRWKVTLATIATGAALAVATAFVSGPGLLHEYATSVLPRASLYGEGGTEAMLLEPSPGEADQGEDEDHFSIQGRAYQRSAWDRLIPWNLSLSASLPRLIAPAGPTNASASGPYLLGIVALVAAARFHLRRRRTGARDEIPDSLFGFAAVVTCVVTSPSGWTMSYVWALPATVLVAELRRTGRLGPRATMAFAQAWIACAIVPPVAGWAALAGTALVIASAGASMRAAAAEAPQ